MKKRMRTTFIHEYQKNPGQSNQPDGFAGPFPAGCPFGYEWLRAFDHVWIEKELTGKDQLKKMLNVHFKTAWKFPETGGKSRQKAEKTYSFRKKTPERAGKTDKIFASGPKGRGESRRRPPVEEISSAAFSTETSDLSGGQSRRLRLRREAESRHFDSRKR